MTWQDFRWLDIYFYIPGLVGNDLCNSSIGNQCFPSSRPLISWPAHKIIKFHCCIFNLKIWKLKLFRDIPWQSQCNVYHSLASCTLVSTCSEQIIIRPKKDDVECGARYKTPAWWGRPTKKRLNWGSLKRWPCRKKFTILHRPVTKWGSLEGGKAICNNWNKTSF